MNDEKNLLIMQMVYLISCALHEIRPDKSELGNIDLAALYELTKKHTLTAMVCMALESTNFFVDADLQVVKKWKDDKDKAIRKNMLLDAERVQILAEMEREGIWYVPLKGILISDLYPKYGMREMADNDILYDASYQIRLKNLFLKRGYEVRSVGKGVHDIYLKPPIYNYEMHTALFSDTFHPDWAQKYCYVKDRLILDDGKNFGYHFSDEDFYVYVTTHAYKHYNNSGTGLRTLVDTYVLNMKKGKLWNWDYIRSELETLKIVEFEEQTRKLVYKLFGSNKLCNLKELTEQEQKMFFYYCDSGTYGTKQNRVRNKMKELQKDEKTISAGTKRKYYLFRLFPGKEWCKQFYPFFYQHPLLIPVLWVFRLIRGILFRRKKIIEEIGITESTK